MAERTERAERAEDVPSPDLSVPSAISVLFIDSLRCRKYGTLNHFRACEA